MLLGLRSESHNFPAARCEVLSTEQMCLADRMTIEDGTAGFELMLSAGQSVANTVHDHYPDHAVLVLCGPGNNGGDGFVAARFLKDIGHAVTVMALVPGRKYKGDAKKAYKEWKGPVLSFGDRPDLPEETVVIDAVFGTGLSKPLAPPVANVFDDVRESGWPVVAVDIPSGVNGDTGEADPATLKADFTVTFFRKKVGHMLMPGGAYCGQVSVHDIGISDAVLERCGFALYENEPDLWRGKLPRPEKAGHKYSRGHVVVLGGAQMTGAARMVSEAAMRIGAGLCTIAADEAAATVYKKAAAHVLYEVLGSFDGFEKHLKDERRNVAVMGPGAGGEDRAGLRRGVLDALQTGRALVLDADALTSFAEHPEELYEALHDRCVLTPHEGEFSKVFPTLTGNRLERTEAAAAQTGAVILLKGSDTILAQRERVTVINIHASPWLATAGAGDVLAGMIGGLLAQNMNPFDAACAAVWMHGEAAERKGPGLVAPDIIEYIPAVLRDLQ